MIGIKLIFFFFLFLFWVAVAGFSLQGMAAGLVASAFVLWLNHDLTDTLVDKKWYFQVRKLFILFMYGFSLLGQIVLANIQVAKIVLSPKMPVQTTVVTFNPQLKTELSKTILANSITLTPGTLTIDVQGDVFTVHALTLSAAQAVVEWPLITLLRRMEENAG